MTYGITGNTQKDELWPPVADLVSWLDRHQIPFCLHTQVADGLRERNLLDANGCAAHRSDDLARDADVVISFGGDGTFLRSAHDVGMHGIPILGVNIGRLGFLADIEVERVQATIRRLEQGEYRVEPRSVLQAELGSEQASEPRWALNEFVIERGGAAGLISIDVHVDGVPLNNYWADGLIIATTTGSTAYSLAVGGPIVAPGCDVVVLSPLAPHSLTVRPIVLPDTSVIEVRVSTDRPPYVLAYDGQSTIIEKENVLITIRRADHQVNLVKLPEQHYFQTLRSKLMWGMGNHRQSM